MELIRVISESELSYIRIKELYKESFPSNERKDLKYLLQENQEIGEIYEINDKNQFIGFICMLCINDIAHIIYFSITPELRNRGYGSKIIKQICEIKKDYRIIVDIEQPILETDNYVERVQRKKFYLRNNFLETDVKYKWHGDYFEILSYGGNISDEEFDCFWESIMEVDENLLY